MRTTGSRDRQPEPFSLRYQELLRFLQAMQFFFNISGRHDFFTLSNAGFATCHTKLPPPIPGAIYIHSGAPPQERRKRCKSDFVVVWNSRNMSSFILRE